jgi:phage-related protein
MRDLIYLGSSFDDLMEFPSDVREEVLFALEIAIEGGKAPSAKPLIGFKGSSVMEVVEAFDGDAYRAVYTVRYRHAVYVLHAFKKKSKSGRATPRNDVAMIKRRLKLAEADAAKHSKGG